MSIGNRATSGWAGLAFGLILCAATAKVPASQRSAAGSAKSAASVAGSGALDPLVTWIGPKSLIREPKFMRAMNPGQWSQLWEQHAGNPPADSVGTPFIPRVNFEKCMAVAIFQGATTNSNGVTIVSIADEANRILIRYDESTYQTSGGPSDGRDGAECRGGAVDVTPYGIFVVPRSNKPIVIEENVQGLKDEPVRWKERAKLE